MSIQAIEAHDVALVLETHNLGRPGAHRRAVASLGRLLAHLNRQSIPVASLGEVVVTHAGLEPSSFAALEELAGRPLAFVHVGELDYYGGKNAGFDATSAPIVVFADSDCWPDPHWLHELLDPLRLGRAVSAGRTSYRDDRLGRAATSIDFLYFRPRPDRTRTRNFYANNVAFRREAFAPRRFPEAPMYRGACQMLGFRLFADAVAIAWAPRAHTVHRFPDTWEELLELRLRRGRDLRLLAPHLVHTYGGVRPRRGRPAGTVVLAGRWIASAAHTVRTESRLRDRAACLAMMTGITALDGVGLWLRRGDTGTDREPALSYHADVDGLDGLH